MVLKALAIVTVSIMLFGCCALDYFRTGPPVITTPTPEPGASPTSTPALQPTPGEGCGPVITSCGCYIYAPGNYALGSDLTCEWGISIYANASGSTLDCNGYSITDSGSQTGDGIFISGTDGLEVRNCRINNFYEGIMVQGASNVVIYNTAVSGSPNGAIKIQESSGCVVRNSEADNSSNGIYIASSNSSSILNNTVTGDLFAGISLWDLNGVNVSGNIAERCHGGLYLSNTTGADIQGNAFTDNNNSGIWLTNSRGNTFTLNRLSGADLGIGVENSTQNAFSGNTLSGLNPALYCLDALPNTDGGGNTCAGSPNDGCAWLSCP